MVQFGQYGGEKPNGQCHSLMAVKYLTLWEIKNIYKLYKAQREFFLLPFVSINPNIN
jgi:hypothetical protein